MEGYGEMGVGKTCWADGMARPAAGLNPLGGLCGPHQFTF